MRVLHFCPHFPPPVAGGMERQAYILVRALVAQGVDCDVLALTFDNQDKHQNNEKFSVFRLKKIRVPLIGNILLAVRIAFFLLSRRYHYDVVHCHTFSLAGLWVGIVARYIGIKTVTKMPNVGDHGLPGLKDRWFGGAQIKVLLANDAIVCLSQESVDELKVAGYPEARTFLVVNGVVIPDVRIHKENKDVSNICFGFAGRLVDQKNIPNLIKAFAKLPRVIGGNESWLVLAGDGPLQHTLRQLAQNLGVESRVKFLGHVENMEEFFQAIDIFVLPSLAEGNSNALLEAMAQGLPTVTTDVGGSSCLLAPIFDQLQIPSEDPEEIANRLRGLAANPMLRDKISDHLLQRATDIFSIDKVAKHYRKFYTQLHANRGEQNFEKHWVLK